MRDGRTIELPPDMTAEEAARLEAEAKAAEKHLGKGPPPKPVPDVRKPPDKGESKKESPKPPARGGPGSARRGAAAPRTASATARLRPAGGAVAQYLIAKAGPVLARGGGLLRRLSQNEQTHDNAAQKLDQAERAVVVPVSEGQSKSNFGQVNAVGGRPAPATDENKGKRKLQESLAQNVPQTIEDVDNFKRDMKARHIGTDVLEVVQGDKNAVVSTFADMERTPPPTPPEQIPEALPPEEVAPSTPPMNLGQGAVAPLQPEHTDVTKYTKEADAKLQQEGVTQEQLDMVDAGDLAAANREKKGMEKTAKTEPLAVQQFARQETEKVDRDLTQEEKNERGALAGRRKLGLSLTTQRQKSAKSALEKKRDEVAAKINGIYKAAQDKVKKKLADLETLSMKRFDEGNAKASKAFEDNVNRELEAYKDDRYSGVFGWARKAKDWLLGMDDLPEVKAIFDRNRAAFVTTIDKLVAEISADNKRVVQECKDELTRAKAEIKDYVDKLGPDLKDIGNKTAGEVNSKLEELDGFIRKKEEELQHKLADKQQAAIKAIDDKIEKMKEAMSGALAKLGNLLLWAAKKFFTWALSKFGYSLADIEAIISKGAAVLKAIFTKPIQFVKNLIGAAKQGFQNFAANFLTHLKDAIFDWLTGSLEGIQLPSTWDLKGIASVALQMLGLTWTNIRGKLVKAIGEPAMIAMERGFDLVVTLVRDGPIAAWEKVQEMGNEIKQAFIEGVQDFIKVKIIQKAVETIVSLFVPGAGIVRAIIGIYDTVVFFIQKAKQIIEMIGNFLGSIGEIAAGNIGAAAGALEKGLATGLKLVINFLAKFLRLDGITAKIRQAIQKLRDKVDKVLDRVVDWVVTMAKRVGRFVVGAARDVTRGALGLLGLRRVVRPRRGEPHTLFFEQRGPRAQLMIASNPVAFLAWLDSIPIRSDASNRAELQRDKATARRFVQQIDVLEDQGRAANVDNTARIQPLMEELGRIVTELLVAWTVDFVRTQPPVYAGLYHEFGRGVRVVISTDELRPGSSPSVTSPTWNTLNHRRMRGGAWYYARGHLMNERLGGPGDDWRNLTPLSRSGNAQHNSKIESYLRPPRGGGETPRAYTYVVTPIYGRTVNTGLIGQINATSNPDPLPIRAIKVTVVAAEQYVPVSLVCSIQELDESGRPKREVGTYSIPNEINQGSPADYDVI